MRRKAKDFHRTRFLPNEERGHDPTNSFEASSEHDVLDKGVNRAASHELNPVEFGVHRGQHREINGHNQNNRCRDEMFQ